MKFLIWVCCLLPASILITAIEHSGNVTLGPLPRTLIAGSAATIAIVLCKRRNKKNEENEDEDKLGAICPSEINSTETRETRWKNEELRQKVILNGDDEVAKQMRSAITITNQIWDMDTCLDPENKRAESRSKLYMLSITPELFLDCYYLFKTGDRDSIKDNIYTERPYPVWETLINMGLYIFETKNNLVVLREIIESDNIEYINSKSLAKRILLDEKLKSL